MTEPSFSFGVVERTKPILPGTGRGTSEAGGGAPSVCLADVIVHRRMVAVDEVLFVRRHVNRLCPSTTLRVVPLPRWGRITYVQNWSITVKHAPHNKTPAEIHGRSVFGNDEMRQALATPAIA